MLASGRRLSVCAWALSAIIMLAVSPATHTGLAAEPERWGTLKGRIVFSEPAPKSEPFEITRDPEVCGQAGLTDESLVIHPEDRGIRHVAVWLDSRQPVPVHPSLLNVPDNPPVLDNKDCRFVPRMVPLRTGQLIRMTNSDPVAHNVAVYARRNQPFSEIVPAIQPLEKTFSKPELLPVRIDCSIHAWMRAWLVISEHPYVAVTDEHGAFEIPNLPAGEWKFHFWQERSGNIRQLIRNEQPVSLEKGIWTLKVQPGELLDLGQLTAPADQFLMKN